MADYPEAGEFVIATVTKIMPYGAFCTLEEYNNQEAFLHVSEVSSGWVKNIRDFVKEGQKIVAMVSRVDFEKRQIDLSLKRASESDRKRKLESYQLAKRADKLLERAAGKLKKNLRDAYKEIGNMLIQEYGDLYSAFEGVKADDIRGKIPPNWLAALKEIAEAEIKEKVIEARAQLTLQSFEGDGVERIRSTLQKISKNVPHSRILYVGAPHYFVDFTVKDHKEKDKLIAKITKLLEEEKGLEFSVEKVRG